MCVVEGIDVDIKEGKGDILLLGEWVENFLLLNYEDLLKYYEYILFKLEVCSFLSFVCLCILCRILFFGI